MKRYAVAAFVGVAFTMVIAGGAWACTNQPQVFAVRPLAAVAGAEVTMHGEAAPAHAPVELRWNGVAGPKVAEVTANNVGNFAMAFTVPDVAPGVYSLMVVPAGSSAGLGRAAFEVRGAPGAAGTPMATAGSFATSQQAASLIQPAGVSSFTGLAVGVAFGLGTLALGSGFALATVRRRPALASR